MVKKRKNGEGTLRKRSDGRWEAWVVIGYDENNLPRTKNVTAVNKDKCLEKLERLKSEIGIVQHNNLKADMTFGEWIDFWYQQYSKITLRPTTQKCDIELYQKSIQKFIDSGGTSPTVIERWIKKINALNQKKSTYEDILRQLLDNLDKYYALLRMQAQELFVRNNKSQISMPLTA